MTIMDRDLVQPVIDSWLGHGNPNSKYWFIGIEESFGRWPWQDDLAKYLRDIADFGLAGDIRDAWKDGSGYSLSEWKGPSTWKYQAAFLKQIEDDYTDILSENEPGQAAYDFAFDENKEGAIARSDANALTAELLPLPIPTDGPDWPYTNVWSTRDEYLKEVLPARVNLIWEMLLDYSQVQYVIVYGKTNMASLGLRILSGHSDGPVETIHTSQSDCQVYSLEFVDGRSVTLAHSPFFGQGFSYEDVGKIAEKVASL